MERKRTSGRAQHTKAVNEKWRKTAAENNTDECTQVDAMDTQTVNDAEEGTEDVGDELDDTEEEEEGGEGGGGKGGGGGGGGGKVKREDAGRPSFTGHRGSAATWQGARAALPEGKAPSGGYARQPFRHARLGFEPLYLHRDIDLRCPCTWIAEQGLRSGRFRSRSLPWRPLWRGAQPPAERKQERWRRKAANRYSRGSAAEGRRGGAPPTAATFERWSAEWAADLCQGVDHGDGILSPIYCG